MRRQGSGKYVPCSTKEAKKPESFIQIFYMENMCNIGDTGKKLFLRNRPKETSLLGRAAAALPFSCHRRFYLPTPDIAAAGRSPSR